ncbi:uncharacterized protein LOC135080440 [Ostrinia nubilalis]|uniref:uncharacterized protein LOC135080440 n=1 Tax=Ostrinia nubilalis TaxID=29057 RepID=UPI00308222EF
MPTSDPLIHPYFYWPNYGYEKYWADGDWIIRDHKYDLGPNETTTKIPLVCGEECNYMNRKIGEVCGQRASWYRFPSCYDDSCYGMIFKEILIYNYRTFETYCKFLDQQCRDTDYYRWTLIHRGACIKRQERILKPLMKQPVLVSRAWAYLSTWNKTYEALFSESTASTPRVIITGRTTKSTTTMTPAKWP